MIERKEMNDNGLITEPDEMRALLEKEKITDISEYIKKSVKQMGPTEIELPDGTTTIVDPDEFSIKWDKESKANKETLDEFLENMPEAITSKREEFVEVLKKHESPLAEAFEKATPEQKFVELVSSKLSFAQGLHEVDKIFTWAEVELNRAIEVHERVLLIFSACMWLDMTQTTYRGIRKIFIELVRNNKVEVKPEFLEAPTYREQVQRAVCKKLLGVKNNIDVENIFDWAEVQLKLQVGIQDRVLVFFQVIQMLDFNAEQLKEVLGIFVKMNKTMEV
jgi:hypothetical protein